MLTSTESSKLCNFASPSVFCNVFWYPHFVSVVLKYFKCSLCFCCKRTPYEGWVKDSCSWRRKQKLSPHLPKGLKQKSLLPIHLHSLPLLFHQLFSFHLEIRCTLGHGLPFFLSIIISPVFPTVHWDNCKSRGSLPLGEVRFEG